MTKEEINEILEKHEKWLRGENGGERADLFGANLRGADLSKADLRGADLYGADLSKADLYRADLYGADLSKADLRGADLYGADLSKADLSGAKLSGANLYRADLRGADLYGADLSKADLSGANLYRANLYGANFPNELLNKYFPICCPEYGAFIGWKKCRDGKIVKLEICEDAKRSSAYGRKCRCSSAKVLSVEDIGGGNAGDEAVSGRDANFIYRVGEIVNVDDFDEDRRNECSTGIHFFITRKEAVDYDL